MADYELLDQNGQPRYITRRVRYFDNQLLVDQDFIDEQKYNIDRQRRHARQLHLSGVCDGLAVTAGLGYSVSISPGTAVDPLGRQILLAEATPYTVTRDGTLRLYILFQEEESDPTSKDTGIVGNSRFKVSPEIDAVEEAALPANAIVLGTVQLTLDGVSITSEGRAYSGVLLPGPAGSSVPTLRSAGDSAPGTALLTGALSVSGLLSAGMITTRNSSEGEAQNGVLIDRSATDREAGLRFGTAGQSRWALRLANDGSEHLRLSSAGGSGTLQSWDYQQGSSSLAGDLSLETNPAWLAGPGTVQVSASSSADVLVGTDTNFLELFQAGDEILLSGDAATATPYRVKEVLDQTELVLTGPASPITVKTSYPYTYRKCTRRLRFGPSRQSMIEFNSSANPGIDKAFMLFKESSASFLSGGGVNARLSIGVLGDFGDTSGETLDLQGGHMLVLNAGLWDSDLDLAVGASTRISNVRGLSFRIDNLEKASLDKDGKLSIGAGYSSTADATLLSVGPASGFTVASTGAVASTALSVGNGSSLFTVDSSGAVTGAAGLTVGSGPKQLKVDANGILTASDISLSGAVTLSGLDVGASGTQFLRRGSNNVLTTSLSVDLSSGDVSGTLPVGRGGTGATAALTANGLIYASSTSAMGSTGALANAVLTTSATNVPTLATTLPSAVQANITQLGTVTACTGLTATGTLAGPTLNATTALQTGGSTRIDSSGNLSNIGTITATGTVSLTGLGTGTTGSSFVRRGTDNKLTTTTNVDLSSGDVTGTLPVKYGGTGAAALTANGLIYASSTSAMGSTGALANAVLTTSATNVPTLATTLPSAVQANITQLGTVTDCTGLTFTGTVSGPTVNATTVNATTVSATTVSGTTVSGATFNASSSLQTNSVTRIDANGNLTGIGNIEAAGTVYLSSLGAGTTGTSFVRLGADKFLATTSNIDLTADVTGTLPVKQGGTGATALTANGVVYATSTSAMATTSKVNSAVLTTSSTGIPTLATTLPSAVQANITQLGTVTACPGLTFTGTLSGPTVNATTALQTNGVTRIDSSGNLSDIGTFSSSGLLTVKNSTSGDGVGGVFIDRSSSSNEANLRFATNGATRWYLQLDNDSTEHLRLSSAGGPGFLHTWEYDSGNQTIKGDVNLETGAVSGPWLTGTGTVKQGTTTTDLTGVGTSFKTTFQVGDEIGVSGGTTTAYIKAIASDTALTLSTAITGLTTSAVSYTYKKYSRKLRFGRNKTNTIEFNSNVNYNSDKAFIIYKDDSENFLGTGTENSRFSIGVFNDIGNTATSDTLDIQGCYMLTLNAGKWDSELDDMIGVQGGTPYGISFRIGNTERMLLDGSGHLRIDQNDANECIRITGCTSSDSFYTILRNESSSTNGFGILRYTSAGALTVGAYLDNNGTWTKMSDRSLKENIEPLSGALEQVMQLRPVSYDWKTSGTRSMGFIAQELEQVFPTLVGSMADNEGRELKCIAETGLTPVAIAAIQELKQQFEARIAALEAQLAAKG